MKKPKKKHVHILARTSNYEGGVFCVESACRLYLRDTNEIIQYIEKLERKIRILNTHETAVMVKNDFADYLKSQTGKEGNPL